MTTGIGVETSMDVDFFLLMTKDVKYNPLKDIPPFQFTLVPITKELIQLLTFSTKGHHVENEGDFNDEFSSGVYLPLGEFDKMDFFFWLPPSVRSGVPFNESHLTAFYDEMLRKTFELDESKHSVISLEYWKNRRKIKLRDFDTFLRSLAVELQNAEEEYLKESFKKMFLVVKERAGQKLIIHQADYVFSIVDSLVDTFSSMVAQKFEEKLQVDFFLFICFILVFFNFLVFFLINQ